MERKSHIILISGEAKPSVDGEKEGIQIRHGDNEFTSGISWLTYLNDLQDFIFIHLILLSFSLNIMCKQKEGRQRGTWNGKKADNEFYKKIVCSLIGLFIFLQPLHV